MFVAFHSVNSTVMVSPPPVSVDEITVFDGHLDDSVANPERLALTGERLLVVVVVAAELVLQKHVPLGSEHPPSVRIPFRGAERGSGGLSCPSFTPSSRAVGGCVATPYGDDRPPIILSTIVDQGEGSCYRPGGWSRGARGS